MSNSRGKSKPGKELRAEITVKNSGESLQESFNISVYTIVGDEKTLIGLYSQSQISSGQGVVKRVAVTCLRRLGTFGRSR